MTGRRPRTPARRVRLVELDRWSSRYGDCMSSLSQGEELCGGAAWEGDGAGRTRGAPSRGAVPRCTCNGGRVMGGPGQERQVVGREQEDPTRLAPLLGNGSPVAMAHNRHSDLPADCRYQNPLNRKFTYKTTNYQYRLPNTPPFRLLSAAKTLDGLLQGHVLQ